jgi:hypothetical protein
MTAKKLGTALVLALTLCLAGCTPPETSKEKQKASSWTEVVFPDSFPTYIPKYPGSKAIFDPSANLRNSTFKNLAGESVMFSTKDSAENVKAFYKAALEASGLAEIRAEVTPVMDMTIYAKGQESREVVAVMLHKTFPGEEVVQLMYRTDARPPQN